MRSVTEFHNNSRYEASMGIALRRWLMDTDIIVYSQCAECDEPGLYLDPANCARCLSGHEPAENDQDEKETSEPFLLLAA